MKQKAIYIKIDAYGDKYYYSNKKMTRLHREDGPAVEYADGSKEWYMNGSEHRTDGPAMEWADGYKEWYIDGVRLTEAEFLAATATKVIHELTLDEIADRLGIDVENLKIVKEH